MWTLSLKTNNAGEMCYFNPSVTSIVVEQVGEAAVSSKGSDWLRGKSLGWSWHTRQGEERAPGGPHKGRGSAKG